MAGSYDLVVIGTGIAATVAASRCREAGWSVAVVDHRPYGGTCAQRGCDPKKVLIGAAETVDQAHRLAGQGVGQGHVGIDWPALMAFKRGFTDPVPASRKEKFAGLGVDTYEGTARFTAGSTVTVGGEILEGRFILIAAGAEPTPLPITGADHLATSDDFLELDRLPGRIAIVGGGYIAFEFAHLARRAGAEVTMLERSPEMLGPFDRDLVGWLVEKSRALGIDVRTATQVEAVEKGGEGYTVHAAAASGREAFTADLAVHAAGRVPALGALDLDTATVEHDGGRLVLNEYLQSPSNPAVYAAGDAAQAGPALTPVSNRDGGTVAANMLGGNHVQPDYTGIPRVVFTIPPLASAGLGEETARRQGRRFRVECRQTPGWYTNRRINEDTAGYKVLIEEDSGRILGAHLLGPHADELINLFALAIRHGLTAEALKETPYAYPTSASDIGSML